MATTVTFNTLIDDVRNYLERGNLTQDQSVYDQIPRVINLSERRIANALNLQGFQNVVTSAMASGTSVYAKPDRWRKTVSINAGLGSGMVTRTVLLPRSYEFCRTYWPDESQTGSPAYYADYDFNNFLFTPTPDAAYPFELVFYQLPPLLDVSNQSNWTTEFAPALLQYAVMMEMATFLKNDERVATFEKQFMMELQAVMGKDMSKIIDRALRREGP